jgi:hypothetical protein
MTWRHSSITSSCSMIQKLILGRDFVHCTNAFFISFYFSNVQYNRILYDLNFLGASLNGVTQILAISDPLPPITTHTVVRKCINGAMRPYGT